MVLGRDYVLMVVFSCAVATLGLALKSGALIIGAMLISPLKEARGIGCRGGLPEQRIW